MNDLADNYSAAKWLRSLRPTKHNLRSAILLLFVTIGFVNIIELTKLMPTRIEVKSVELHDKEHYSHRDESVSITPKGIDGVEITIKKIPSVSYMIYNAFFYPLLFFALYIRKTNTEQTL